MVSGAHVWKAARRSFAHCTDHQHCLPISYTLFGGESAGIAGPAPELQETALTRAIDTESRTQEAARQSSDIATSDEQLHEEVRASGDYITEIATLYGLDPKIVKALIEVESGGDPYAVGDSGESLGLMQIQPRWHGERMARLGVTDLMDPYQNVLIGCDILAEKLAEYGNLHDALSAYNAGAPCDSGYAERVMSSIVR